MPPGATSSPPRGVSVPPFAYRFNRTPTHVRQHGAPSEAEDRSGWRAHRRVRPHVTTVFAPWRAARKLQLYSGATSSGTPFSRSSPVRIGDGIGALAALPHTNRRSHVRGSKSSCSPIAGCPFRRKEEVRGQIVRHSAFAEVGSARAIATQISRCPDVRALFIARTPGCRRWRETHVLLCESKPVSPLYGVERQAVRHSPPTLAMPLYLRIADELYLSAYRRGLAKVQFGPTSEEGVENDNPESLCYDFRCLR